MKKFIDFLLERNNNKIWRAAVGQPHYSKIKRRPSAPFLLPGNVVNMENFGDQYYQALLEKNEEKMKELYNYLREKYIGIPEKDITGIFTRKFKLSIQTLEDAFQDAIIDFNNYIFKKAIHPKDGNLEAYFKRIIKNKLYDHLKSYENRKSRDLDVGLFPDISASSATPVDLAINKELRLKIIKIIEDIVKNIDKKKVAAFCMGFGLGCFENGKVKIPDNFQFGPFLKKLKQGDYSYKIDLEHLIDELEANGIRMNKSQINSAFVMIRNYILGKLN